MLLLISVLGMLLEGAGGSSPGCAGGRVPGKLPSLMAPLRWDLDADAIRTALPGGNPRIVGYGSGSRVLTAGPREWAELGDVVLTIDLGTGSRPVHIEIATTETRSECRADDKPKQCRNAYGPPLVRAYDAVKRALTKELGRGREGPITDRRAEGPELDRREVGANWQLEGYVIGVTLGKTEEDEWVVTIAATDRCRMPSPAR